MNTQPAPRLVPRFDQVPDARPPCVRAGDVLVSTLTGAMVQITSRKTDGSGWWCGDHGGLADSVITSGLWVRLVGFTPET